MRRILIVGLSLLGALTHPSVAGAQPAPMRVPWTDVAPARDGEVVRAAAVGIPDARIGRFAARRDSARTAARRRAIEAVHAWADDALAQVRAHPRQAAAVHQAIDRDARVSGARPLVDGGAVVVVEISVAALRGACGTGGLPWVG